MKVAPFESCISCYHGDVTTAVYFQGSAEFIIAAVHHMAGIPLEEANGMCLVAWEELGHDPGKVPAGRIQMGFRLCPDCAEKTGARIDSYPPGEDEEVFAYVEPDD